MVVSARVKWSATEVQWDSGSVRATLCVCFLIPSVESISCRLLGHLPMA